jgi:S1/P1 Nuclease
MMRRFFQSVLFLGLFFSLPFRSMAWGMLGHRIVAQIADSYLNAKARAAIKQIMGNESLAMAANWADFIKSDTSYRYLETWHYIDFPKGMSYDQMKQELKTDSAADVYTAINRIVNELKNKNLPQEKKLFDLRLLIHFIGDIHQPLHVGVEGTSGGNDIKVTWFGTPTNLHRVWDANLIEYQQLSYTEYVTDINHTTLAQRKKWQGQPLSQWLFESYSLAEQIEGEVTEQNAKLSYRYNFDHVQTLNEQLLKGGVRLAGLLNSIFGS